MKLKYDLKTEHGNMTVKDSDLINPDDFSFWEKLFLLHNEFGVIALVFAQNERDAFDEIADKGKLDSYRVPDCDAVMEIPEEIEHLGNYCLAYKLGDYVRMIEIPYPKFSICGLLAAAGTVSIVKEWSDEG